MFLVFLHASHLQPLEHRRDIRTQVHRRLIQLLPLEHPQNANCKHEADTSSWFISFGLITPSLLNHSFSSGLDRDGRGSFAFFRYHALEVHTPYMKMQSIFHRRKGIKVLLYFAKCCCDDHSSLSCCCSLFVDIYSVCPMVVQMLQSRLRSFPLVNNVRIDVRWASINCRRFSRLIAYRYLQTG